MARITRKQVGKSEQYLSHREVAQSLGEEMDCAVRAVAVACNVPYEEARSTLIGLGRKPRGRTPTQLIRAAIESLGSRVEEYSFSKYHSIIRQYPGKHKGKSCITTHHPDRFPEVWKDGKTYLFFTNGHVLCVKDGVNHDWTRGRSLRAYMIWEVS